MNTSMILISRPEMFSPPSFRPGLMSGPPGEEAPGVPLKEGGKTPITLDEAKEMLRVLDIVLEPITSEEAQREGVEEACLRELAAGPFPIVVRLRERMAQFVKTAGPSDTFTISHGEFNVLSKSVDCAEALGRGDLIRNVAVAGGIGAAGLLLFLLL